MIGLYLIYGAGYAGSLVVIFGGLLMSWVALEESAIDLLLLGLFVILIGVFLLGGLLHLQFPPSAIAEACK